MSYDEELMKFLNFQDLLKTKYYLKSSRQDVFYSITLSFLRLCPFSVFANLKDDFLLKT